MTGMPEASQNGATLVTFYDGSVMTVAELLDEVSALLCLAGDSSFVVEIAEQLELPLY